MARVGSKCEKVRNDFFLLGILELLFSFNVASTARTLATTVPFDV